MAGEATPRPAGLGWLREDDWGARGAEGAPPTASDAPPADCDARTMPAPRISTFAAGLLLGCGRGGPWGEVWGR